MAGSFADFVDDWQHLVSAMENHESELEGLETVRTALADLLQTALDRRALQQQLKAQGEDMTVQMQDIVQSGNDLVRNIRSQIRGKLGSRSLLLKEFGVAPLGRRRRKSQSVTTPPPPPPTEITANRGGLKIVKSGESS
jgi:hypothetical protein